MINVSTFVRLNILIWTALFSSTAMAWWNEDWPYRLAVNIDASSTGANLSETNQDVTVLLKLHSANFTDFLLVKENLADVRIIGSDDKTPLKFHVEHVDLINQLAYIWIKLPTLAAGVNTEKLWLYYGNESATSASDAEGSFDVDTALALHFSSMGATPQDVTAYATPIAEFSGSFTPSAVVAGGAVFEAQNRLLIPNTPSMAVTPEKGLTVSLWFKPTSEQTDAILFERSGSSASVQVGIKGNNLYANFTSSTGTSVQTPPVAGVRVDSWQHLALVLSANRMELFLDGNMVTFTGISLEPMSGEWSVASSMAGDKDYIGEIDELVIATTARNGSWIRAAAISQGPANTLLVPQPAEQLGNGGGSSLWMVLFRSNDQTGWTVIFLLALMAFFSWIVMLGKFLYIRRVGKDNKGFLEEYNKIKFKNPALADYEDTDEDQQMESSPILQAIFGKHDHYQSSPIYRLYHRGIRELQERISVSAKTSQRGLNSAAVDAIKAAVDAQIVREVQRLNSKMVLLTIAISGGPFLGLLGTVLGVMMTFAAIAASGDVNIAAIAPGVAAALLTTVAGLIVAIPALFGYNYLMTRIKENVSDMKVFSEEYVTRLAEYYRDVGVAKSTSVHQTSVSA